jgi:inosine-uridine nucleoside N-ribohydrolase
MGVKSKKVFLDTDIGSDIDDAACLAYLLCNPECELLGITTVSGMARERAMIADTLCRAAGKRVPIRVGAERPLIVGQRQPEAAQAEKLPQYPHAGEFPGGPAIELMRDAIMANPGEVELLAIGPMTNVALLFAVYPEAAAKLGGLTVMGGDFLRGGDALEWNIICDPHAASMMYACGAPAHRSVGLNVTTSVTMRAKEVYERFSHPLLRIVADYAEVFFRGAAAGVAGNADGGEGAGAGGADVVGAGSGGSGDSGEGAEASGGTLTFHDPLAAVTLFDGGVCEFRRGRVSVELADQSRLGRTEFAVAGAGVAGAAAAVAAAGAALGDWPHEVAGSVSPEKFFEAYFSVFR